MSYCYMARVVNYILYIENIYPNVLLRCAKTFSFTSDKIVANVELSLLETIFRNAPHIIELLVHV
jgi:hypothetical protein